MIASEQIQLLGGENLLALLAARVEDLCQTRILCVRACMRACVCLCMYMKHHCSPKPLPQDFLVQYIHIICRVQLPDNQRAEASVQVELRDTFHLLLNSGSSVDCERIIATGKRVLVL